MGLNVSSSMGYQLENKDALQNTAKMILSKGGNSSEKIAKIIDIALYANNQKQDSYTNPQLSVLKASTQISLNNTLKETLNYLKNQTYKKAVKTPRLGELRKVLALSNENSEENPYKGELYNFQIDKNAKNIFVA